MEINEVHIGDMVTFTVKGKKKTGKIIHNHNNNPALAGHVNVEVINKKNPEYPITIHVSKLKPALKEETFMEHHSKLFDLIDHINNGENLEAQEIFHDVLQSKIDELLNDAKEIVAHRMFNTEECQQCDEETVDEALKGKQHKIDMNKNGKLDAHDFKILRSKKGMKEEVEEIEEGNAENKAKKNAFVQKLGHKVSSFSTQKAHMQSGRNALKNKPTGYHNEEVEQVDELKKSTLQSYADKVGGSRGGNDGGQLGALAKKAHGEFKAGNLSAVQKTGQKFVKREKGLRTAVDKLHQKRFQNEEVEQIDELSKKTLKSYVKKATTSAARNWAKGEKEEDKSMSTDGNKYPAKQERHMKNAGAAYNTASKREKGIKTAQQKLQSQKEAYEDPYAAKKAAEMKKGHADAMAAAKKEYEASKESKGKVNTKKVFSKIKEAMVNEISRFKEREIAHELRHEDEYERKHKRPYVAPARRPVSEPHAVHVGGKKWKSFGSHAHASAVAKKLEAKGKKATVHKEEVEQMDEVITKKTPTGEVIRDFIKSKNPKFAGKSKKERIRMALGAKYAMMKKEEIELDEGNAENKAKKNAYVMGLGKKAAQDVISHAKSHPKSWSAASAPILKNILKSKDAGKLKNLGRQKMRMEEMDLEEGNAENKAKKNAHISATADDKLKQSSRAAAAANPGLTKRGKYRLAQGGSGDDLARTREKLRKN